MEHSHEPGHAHQHHHHEGAKEQARGGDLFDPLLTLEEDLVEEGFQEGYTSGFVYSLVDKSILLFLDCFIILF